MAHSFWALQSVHKIWMTKYEQPLCIFHVLRPTKCGHLFRQKTIQQGSRRGWKSAILFFPCGAMSLQRNENKISLWMFHLNGHWLTSIYILHFLPSAHLNITQWDLISTQSQLADHKFNPWGTVSDKLTSPTYHLIFPFSFPSLPAPPPSLSLQGFFFFCSFLLFFPTSLKGSIGLREAWRDGGEIRLERQVSLPYLPLMQ